MTFFAATSTAPTQFTEAAGTARARPAATVTAAAPEGLHQWLTSPEARAYAGHWVLLDDALQVLDAAPSPSELLDRHPEEATPVVVFVDAAGVSFAG